MKTWRGGVSIRRRAFYIFFVFIAVLFASSAWGAQEVRVGVYEDPPLVFTDEQGRYQGVYVDVLEAIAEKNGWTLRFVPGTVSYTHLTLPTKRIV